MWWHTQKPDFVFRRNWRVHLNRWGASVQSTTGSRVVHISGSNAGYTMFWGSVKGTGYSLHSPVSPFTSPPCVTVCHHIRLESKQLQRFRRNLVSPPKYLRSTVYTAIGICHTGFADCLLARSGRHCIKPTRQYGITNHHHQ